MGKIQGGEGKRKERSHPSLKGSCLARSKACLRLHEGWQPSGSWIPAPRTVPPFGLWLALCTAVSLHPAWDWGGAAALGSLSPQDSCKVFCIFVFIDKYSLLQGKQTGQSPARHTWSRKCQSWVSQGLFQQLYQPRSFLTPKTGLANGAPDTA